MADSKAASCFWAFCFWGADAGAAEVDEPAARAGSGDFTDLDTCGLLIRLSAVLEADIFFFSAISASPAWRTGDDYAFIPDQTACAQPRSVPRRPPPPMVSLLDCAKSSCTALALVAARHGPPGNACGWSKLWRGGSIRA